MWLIILFILGFLISFFLTLYSMRDFLIKPGSKSMFGVYLVRNLSNFNIEFLNSILVSFLEKDLISFERLFKDGESALVIFGPSSLLKYHDLNLQELEDYTSLDLSKLSVFEAHLKSAKNLKEHLPTLSKDERIWIQILCKNGKKQIDCQIRIVIYSDVRLKQLSGEFQANFKDILVKVPRPYSKHQLFEFYKGRNFLKEDMNKLTSEDILNLSLFL